MLASYLVSLQEEARFAREKELHEAGFSIREILGLDELPAEKLELLQQRPTKRRKVQETNAYNPWGFPPAYAKLFPALQRRNHYIIHQHAATAPHFDLRLLCTEGHSPGACDVCGTTHADVGQGRVPGTLSFAIPKGLSGMKMAEKRIAIETPLHGVAYSCHEGGGVGTSLLYDVGTYEILTSRTGKHDKGAATDDEDAETDETSTVWGGLKGINHERALAKAYKGRPKSEAVSFTIKLTGVRYQMVLTMSHPKADHKWGMDKLRGKKTKRKSWVLALQLREKNTSRKRGIPREMEVVLNRENLDLGPVSVLTGRSMEQLKAEGDMMTGAGPQDTLEDLEADDFIEA